MQSKSNLSDRELFLNQELQKSNLSFSEEIEQIYSSVINWLLTLDGMNEFDKEYRQELESNNLIDTASQFSQFFPTHTLKVYQSLLNLEKLALTNLMGGLLERPSLTILDNGCGGGAASVALLMLLMNFQQFKSTNYLPLTPVSISFVGLDPNENALLIYSKFLELSESKAMEFSIDTDVKTLSGKLHENTANILNAFQSRSRTNCVVLALSNVIRPLANEQREASQKRFTWKKLGIDKFFPISWGESIGFNEIEVQKAILDSNKVDQFFTVLVAGKLGLNTWQAESEKFLESMKKSFSSHHHHFEMIHNRQFNMENPHTCYWRKQGHKNYGPVKYIDGAAIVSSNNYFLDAKWKQALDPDNLLLAWARVRNSLEYEMIEDTIEIRLFEANILERLAKLRDEIFCYKVESLALQNTLEFPIPKGANKEPRPMSLCRLEEQILATAILQVTEIKRTRNSRVYSNRLSTETNGERLYSSWFDSYNKYREDARNAAKKNPTSKIVQTDLSSYYPSIIQSKLSDFLRHELKLYDSERSVEITKYIVGRGKEIEDTAVSIPQGHIASGAFADIYLTEIDEYFTKENPLVIEYFRFVDDMVFIIPSNLEASDLIKILDEKLISLGLSRSEIKTKIYTSKEFLEISKTDDELETISKAYNYLLSDLYKVDKSYIKLAKENWWGFIEQYQILLASIGVFIAIPRLSRKLQQNHKWWEKLFFYWRRIPLPPINKFADLQNIPKWKETFTRLNSTTSDSWVLRRVNLINDLTNLFKKSLISLVSGTESERSLSTRRIKFAVNRLGQLGFANTLEDIRSLLTQSPWMINVRRVCKDLALQNEVEILIAAYQELLNKNADEWAFVRSSILKAFSNTPKPTDTITSFLKSSAINAPTVLEKTMASESLILIRDISGEAQVTEVVKKSADDYLNKNYVLLHKMFSTSDHLGSIPVLKNSRILNDALDHKLNNPELSMIKRYEPEILRQRFYESEYPDDADEFESIPS